MTDKEKFRKEVKKLKSNLIHGACSSQIAMETRCKEEAYNEVLAILDTMQEEPVRKVWHYANEHPEIEKPILLRKVNGVVELAICHDENFYPEIGEMWAYIDDILNLSNIERTAKNWKEPVSDGLGDYINELSKQFPEVSFAKLSRIAIRVAKWQKEQMMAKAVDGYVIKDVEEGNGDFLLSADYLPKSMGLKDQQKVKVIVIKED